MSRQRFPWDTPEGLKIVIDASDAFFRCQQKTETGDPCGNPLGEWIPRFDICESCREKIEEKWRSTLDKYRKDLAEALLKFPKACKLCLGTGGRTEGGSFEIPPDWTDCPECLSNGKCPRCEGEVLIGEKDEFFCSLCDWAEIYFGNNVLPYPPEREE